MTSGTFPIPRPQRARRRSGGFTLVEILAAVMLLSIGLLAVLTAGQAARDTQRRAVYLSIARNVAQSKIEELRSMSFNSIISAGSVTTSSSLPRGNSITVSVSRYPVNLEQDLCIAAVVVAYPEAKGTRTIRYDTLIARR